MANLGILLPINHHPNCDWFNCAAGGGLAGNGRCIFAGAWWMNDCPAFVDDEEWWEEQERLCFKVSKEKS